MKSEDKILFILWHTKCIEPPGMVKEIKFLESKMVICPQCNIKHDPGEEFCIKCGKFLLLVEETIPSGEKTEERLICPMCQILYKKGNYCKKCGALLKGGTSPKEKDAQPLGKKSIQWWSREWLKIFKEKKELEICMRKLEAQRERISSDVFHHLCNRYRDRFESLSPLYQECEMKLNAIGKRTSEEIDFMEKMLKPIQKRLDEFQSLYKLGAVTKVDFVKEKKEIKKEIKSRKRNIKKHRRILSLLPSKMERGVASPGLRGNLFRPQTLLPTGAIIILMGVGGYFLWPRHSDSSRPMLKEMAISPSPPLIPHPLSEGQEVEKIRSLFENIKQANLQKDIDLFMFCFSLEFKNREEKRLEALKMWENFNYLDLSYDLKKQKISGDTAHVRLEWLVKTAQKIGRQLQDGRTVLDVTLRREDGHWKIREIKPIS